MTKAVQTRLSASDYKKFMRIVDKYGEGVSVYLRRIIKTNIHFIETSQKRANDIELVVSDDNIVDVKK